MDASEQHQGTRDDNTFVKVACMSWVSLDSGFMAASARLSGRNPALLIFEGKGM